MTKYFQEIQEELEHDRNPFAYYPEGEETSMFPPIEEKRTKE